MAIEKVLTSTADTTVNTADVQEVPLNIYTAHLGFIHSLASDFNALYALDTRLFWQFLKNTQQPELDKLHKSNPHDWELKILERFDRPMKKHGILHLLKKGLGVDDAHFNLM